MFDEDPELKKLVQQGREFIELRQRMLDAGEAVTPQEIARRLKTSLENAIEIMQFADTELGEYEAMMIQQRAAEYRNIITGDRIDG